MRIRIKPCVGGLSLPLIPHLFLPSVKISVALFHYFLGLSIKFDVNQLTLHGQ